MKRDGARTLERKEMGLESVISNDWGLKNTIDRLESALSSIQGLKSALKKKIGLESVLSYDWGLKGVIDKAEKHTIWYTRARKYTKKEKRWG